MGQGGVCLNRPSSKSQGGHPAGQSDKEEGGQEGSSQSKSWKVQGPQLPGDPLPSPFTSQALPPGGGGRGKSAPDSPPPENLLSLTAPSSGQPSQSSQPPSRITYSCEPVCELSLLRVCPLCYRQRCVCVSFGKAGSPRAPAQPLHTKGPVNEYTVGLPHPGP